MTVITIFVQLVAAMRITVFLFETAAVIGITNSLEITIVLCMLSAAAAVVVQILWTVGATLMAVGDCQCGLLFKTGRPQRRTTRWSSDSFNVEVHALKHNGVRSPRKDLRLCQSTYEHLSLGHAMRQEKRTAAPARL
jgi:hypothetical protein